ncbi:hypothetical protein KTI07_04135 [Acinetobacter lwoffii]|uniref:hypothetical protein n=1 Tax=Acinetobacter lwoffii TaxID=28090 RepID=UPI0021CD6335|nr:hypothetical protein [Acinetobacter lwoffii]MCU4438713.1 hypothetical protein [Acinetobacter lwoffii]
MSEKKTAPDWERIEIEYRAGVQSIRQIAQAFGVSDGAIRKRAKTQEWTRDLNGKIHAKAEAIVRTQVVRTEVLNSPEYKATEKETIEANANLIASIQLNQRKDIQRARSLCMGLFDELEHMIGIENANLLYDFGDVMRKEDDKGQDKLNDLYMKIIQLPNRVKSMKDLGDTLKTLVGLEVQAYGLDKKQEEKADDLTALINRIAQSNSSTFQPVAHDPEFDNENGDAT